MIEERDPSIDHQATRRRVQEGLKRRYRKERTFKLLGLGAMLVGIAFLSVFFSTLIATGHSALQQTRILLEIELEAEEIDPRGERAPDALGRGNYNALVRDALDRLFPNEGDRRARLRDLVLDEPALLVLLAFLMLMNAAAIVLRKRFERRY